MKKPFLSKKYLSIIVTFSLFLIPLLFLINQSIEKGIFILFTLVVWLILFIYTRKLIISSILYILFILPFNITIQLPSVVEFFNTEFLLSTPFVNGVYVNYLVPTISILDLGAFLLLLSIFTEKGLFFYINILKSFKNGIFIFICYLILQNIYLSSFLSVFNSLRIVLYIVATFAIIKLFEERKLTKIFLPVLIITFINVLIQGAIGIIQFVRGSSIGIRFLGESQVVSGMQGSSFIELGQELYLRAYGTFPHPNILGGFLVLSLFIGFILIKRYKVLGLLLILLSLFFLTFTFSRVCILLGGIVSLAFIVNSILKTNIKMFSFTPLLFFERFTDLIKGGDNSLNDRVNLLKSGWKVIKDNFFVGTGIGNFVKAMEMYVPRTSSGILLLQPVHNTLILIFTELGPLGFLFLLYILLNTLHEKVKRVSLLKLLVLLSIIIIGSFDHYFFSLPQGLILFLFFFFLLFVDLEPLNNNKENIN